MKVAILTDSASNLSADFVNKHKNLFQVPLMIMIDGVGYRDQVEVSAEEVYEKLDEHVITTSLPKTEDLVATLEQIKKEGFSDVVCINISSGLSGTFNAFRLSFEHVDGLNITHYDSKTLGMGLGLLVEYALELVEADTPITEMVERLDHMRYVDSIAFYTINTLTYLRRGGRIGKVEGTIGNILHIKPVITVNDDGVYVTMSKAFGMKRSLISMRNILVEKFGDDLIDLVVHYGNAPDQAMKLGEKLKEYLNIRNVSISQLTPVLGVHTGPDMFAYVARRIYE